MENIFDKMHKMAVDAGATNAKKHKVVQCVVFVGERVLNNVRQNMCYNNAAQLVMEDVDRYVYCVGQATQESLPIPLDHAWVFDTKENKYYDTTWQVYGDINGHYQIQETLTGDELIEFISDNEPCIPPNAFDVHVYKKKKARA